MFNFITFLFSIIIIDSLNNNVSKLIPIDVIRFDNKKLPRGYQCWILFYISLFLYIVKMNNRDTTKNHNKLIYRCDIYMY